MLPDIAVYMTVNHCEPKLICCKWKPYDYNFFNYFYDSIKDPLITVPSFNSTNKTSPCVTVSSVVAITNESMTPCLNIIIIIIIYSA